MKLKKTTIGGIAATLLFAVGCGSSGGGTATGGSGGAAGTGEGGKPTGGTGGTATGGSGTGGATGGRAGGDRRGRRRSAGRWRAGGRAGSAERGGTGGAEGARAVSVGARGEPPLPPALAVPAGATLAIHDQGAGVQIYTCTPSGGAGGAAGSGADAGAISYSWVLKGPDAKLYDATGAQVGTHGIGPAWTSSDGSVVNGTKVEQVNAPATAPGAIPWLLLRASSTTGTGVFSNVTYVQRLNTSGGVAPATGCGASTSGTDTSVAYTADYYFYTGGGVGGLAHATRQPADRDRRSVRGARSPFMTTGSARRSTPAPPAAARGAAAAARMPGPSPIPGCSRGRTRSSPTPPSRRSGRTAWVPPGPPPTGA